MKPRQDSRDKWAAGPGVQLIDICSAQLVRGNSRVSQSFKDTLSLKDFSFVKSIILEETITKISPKQLP